MLGLRTLNKTLAYAIQYVPFIVIVVFQSEIRRALTAIGKNPLFQLLNPTRTATDVIAEVIYAVTTLSSQKVGALIVLERSQRLRNYVDAGIKVDALVSYDLLVNIFTPDTPLHDGAVVISEGRIAAAACFLPLTLQPSLSKSYGTRHRAAVGISEETDAIAVVVSEETGQISVAIEGRITSGLWAEALDQQLRSHLARPSEPAPAKVSHVSPP
jgi:diadenylate cyclase